MACPKVLTIPDPISIGDLMTEIRMEGAQKATEKIAKKTTRNFIFCF